MLNQKLTNYSKNFFFFFFVSLAPQTSCVKLVAVQADHHNPYLDWLWRKGNNLPFSPG